MFYWQLTNTTLSCNAVISEEEQRGLSLNHKSIKCFMKCLVGRWYLNFQTIWKCHCVCILWWSQVSTWSRSMYTHEASLMSLLELLSMYASLCSNKWGGIFGCVLFLEDILATITLNFLMSECILWKIIKSSLLKKLVLALSVHQLSLLHQTAIFLGIAFWLKVVLMAVLREAIN